MNKNRMVSVQIERNNFRVKPKKLFGKIELCLFEDGLVNEKTVDLGECCNLTALRRGLFDNDFSWATEVQ